MKRVINADYQPIKFSVSYEQLQDCADKAKDMYEETDEDKYWSIMEQIYDVLDWAQDTWTDEDFSGLVKRFINFALTGEDAGGHFTIVEEEDDYIPYQGKMCVYSIAGAFGENVGNDKYFEDGQEGQAIRYWFQEGAKYPTCTTISGLGYQGQNIRDWAAKNWDKVDMWAQEYGCPYEIDYLLEQCESEQRISDSKYPDQIYPFCFG